MVGKTKFVIFYLLTGIIGEVGTYIIAPTSNTTHLGASGAIYGLFGIYLFMVFLRKHLISRTDAQIVGTIFVIVLIITFIVYIIINDAHIFLFFGVFVI